MFGERGTSWKIMENERTTIRTLYRQLWLFVWWAKILGLLPWRLEGEKLTRAGIVGRIYSMIFYVFCSIVFLVSMYKVLSFALRLEPSAMFHELLTTTATLEILMNLHQEIVDPGSGIKVIEGLSQYDRRVKLLGRKRKDSFYIFWLMAMPMIAYMMVTVKMLFNNEYKDRSAGIQGVLLVRYLIMSVYMGVLKFCIMANLLQQRYKHLNESMVPVKGSNEDENASSRSAITIHDVIQLHAVLVKVTRILATIYSAQILLWCSGFINTVLQVISAALKLKEYTHGVVQVLQTLVQVLTICWTCHRTAYQANKIGAVLLKTDRKFKQSYDSAVAIDAAMYVHNQRVTFTAGNLWDVNLTTILMLSKVTLDFALIVFK